MADTKQEVIIDLKLDGFEDLEKLKVAITQNREEQKALQKDYREGRLSVEAYAKESVRLEAALKKNQNEYRNTQQAVTGVKTKFDELLDSNKELVKENRNIAQSLIAGIPGLSKFKDGVVGLNTAFKANPIGLVITALVALKGIFSQNAIIADTLSFAVDGLTKGFSFIIDTIVTTVSSFDRLALAISNPIQFFKDLFTGTVNATKAGFEAAQAIDAFTVAQAKANQEIQIAEVRIQALEKSLKDRTKSEQERIKIANEAANLEIENAKRKESLAAQELANEQLRLKDKTLSGEEEAKLIDLQTKVFIAAEEAKTAEAQRSTRINILLAKEEQAEKRESKNQEVIDFIDTEAQKNQALIEAYERRKEINDQAIQQSIDADIAAAEQEIAAEDAKQLKLQEFFDREIARDQIRRDAIIANERAIVSAKQNLAAQLGQTLQSLFGQSKAAATAGIILEKGAAVSQIISSTGIANAKAVAASPLTAGLPFVAINTASAALSIANLIAQAARSIGEINSTKVSAAAGGGDFITTKPTLLLVGDNPGARERVTVTPLSGKGKTTISPNSGLIKAAGGISLTTGLTGGETLRAANQAQSSLGIRQLRDALSGFQPVLVLQDFEKANNTKVQIETIATVL